MSLARLLFLALLLVRPADAQVRRFIPTSEVVAVATMAARNEGYNPDLQGTYLHELRTADGKEPYAGYTSIALYHDGHPVRDYSIRIETGDVIDATMCKVFRFPDLLAFKRRILEEFGSQDVTLEQLAFEVGCGKMDVVSNRSRSRK
jgi:hypothetical protein